MYRASTPTHKFTIPFKQSEIAKMLITYGQQDDTNDIVLEKTLEDAVFISEDTFFITLTQEETSMFTRGMAKLQIRVKTKNGSSVPSKIYYIDVFDVLNDEVM